MPSKLRDSIPWQIQGKCQFTHFITSVRKKNLLKWWLFQKWNHTLKKINISHLYDWIFELDIRILVSSYFEFYLIHFPWFCFSWVNPLLYRGFKKELDQDDLYETLDYSPENLWYIFYQDFLIFFLFSLCTVVCVAQKKIAGGNRLFDPFLFK